MRSRFRPVVGSRGPRPSGLTLAAAVFAVACALHAQSLPTATLVGRVTSPDGVGIGNVEIRISSESLIGNRQTKTSPNGAFLFALLPNGDYDVRFEAAGLQAAVRRVTLTAPGTVRIIQELEVAQVSESVEVGGPEEAAGPPPSPTISSSFEKGTVDRLPVDRSLRSIALLAPGITENGLRATTGSANERRAMTMSGALSYSNLFLVNGVVANENLRGQPQDLFIEEAIEETTVSTGSISVEYGRFTGGVVNVVTQSGGNHLHGSFRTTFRNDHWTANNPYDRARGTDHRVDDVTPEFEETLGGPLWRDRIWFFVGGRQEQLSDSRETRPTALEGDVDPTPIPYVHTREEVRTEAKLTAALGSRHRLVATVTDVAVDETNFAFDQNVLDTEAVAPRRAPHFLFASNYSGVLSGRLFIEAQYSRRRFSIEQGGTIESDLIRGTRIFDQLRSNAGWHSPQAPNRSPNRYDNESYSAKGTYFVPTTRFGSHEVRAGYERFRESARANYYYSGSDFWIRETAGIIRGEEIFPSFRPGMTRIQWYPIFETSHGSELVTNSGYVEDRLQLGSRWSFQLGVRYDDNHDRDSRGVAVPATGSWSPRFAFRFDPTGRGTFEVHGGYARYADKIHDNIANAASDAGLNSFFQWSYGGPCVNCDRSAPTADLVGADEALRILFNWFWGAGGTAIPPISASVPSISTRISPDLKAPSAREITIGAGLALSPSGFLRMDLLQRDFRDQYSSRIDLSTGTSEPDRFGNVSDVAVIGNSNRVDRRYVAVQGQLAWRFGPKVEVGGSYTWSRLTGNAIGEDIISAVPADIEEYPEYRRERWNYPYGYLSAGGPSARVGADQRHRARLWLIRDFRPRWGVFSAAIVQSYDSGLPYEAVGRIDPRGWFDNPGYRTPPADLPYFFTRPGAFRTDDVTETDLAVTVSIRVFRNLELFTRPEILNVFNEKAVVAVDKTVLTAANSIGLRRFNPFTEIPVRGQDFELGPGFGRASSAASYQTPRTFRVAVGLRF